MTANEIKQNAEHGYYNGVKAETMVLQGVIPTSPVSGAEFELAEMDLDGSKRLIAIFPGTIGGNGPGRKLTATEKGGGRKAPQPRDGMADKSVDPASDDN